MESLYILKRTGSPIFEEIPLPPTLKASTHNIAFDDRKRKSRKYASDALFEQGRTSCMSNHFTDSRN